MTFYGAANEVTGSCYLLETGKSRILIDCGLFQGSPDAEKRNHDKMLFDPASIDTMILTHAHIDHSGRIPLLAKWGFNGKVYTHVAAKDLCRIMLKDAGFINEKNADWENKKRQRKGLPKVEPVYTTEDAKASMKLFRGVEYGKQINIGKGIDAVFHDAGHILGSSIVEINIQNNGTRKKLVFSGDLGKSHALLQHSPTPLYQADLVLMETTYGDRLHRSSEDTIKELEEIFSHANENKGNILIPSFAVGRSQELLYLFSRHYRDWNLQQWQFFLDSPMAIEATTVYSKHKNIQNSQAAKLWSGDFEHQLMPNLHFVKTSNQSMNLNRIKNGAVIIAGSGMCNGGRIRHHMKHNIWQKNCHILFVGFQAAGTPGRAIVDGAKKIRLWGETIQVAANIHTIGGLSAHADQKGLLDWYANFEGHPHLVLVHGENKAMQVISEKLRERYPGISLTQPQFAQSIEL